MHDLCMQCSIKSPNIASLVPRHYLCASITSIGLILAMRKLSSVGPGTLLLIGRMGTKAQ